MNISLGFLVISVVITLARCDMPRTGRVLQGTTADIREFPFYAHLNGCGGVILSNVWVMTAAHCAVAGLPGPIPVWVGGNSKSTSQRYMSAIVHLHPQYQNKFSYLINDIAVLKLNQPLMFSDRVQPAQLPVAGTSMLGRHRFVGGGKDESGIVTEVIMKIDLDRITIPECLNMLPRDASDRLKPILYPDERHTFCVTRPDDLPGICKGDSGSPLVLGNVVTGLVSYIPSPSCSLNRISFMVNVASYVPWIKSVTGIQ